ncbi:MAG TPA: hypothetical protein VIV09_08245, partial [Pseudolabrys sp.]
MSSVASPSNRYAGANAIDRAHPAVKLSAMQDRTAAPSSTFIAADGDGYEMSMGRWSRRLAEHFIDFAGSTDG